MRRRLEDYDLWNTKKEEELLLMPYLFHLHTHSEKVGLRISNPKERKISVDAANFTKGLPKETSESISEQTMIQLSGNIFRTSALTQVMEGDG
eukprot:13429429-Heterocapsa_arctica.AAC.1